MSNVNQKSTTDASVFRSRMVERLAAVDELSEPLRLDPLKGWPMWLAVVMLMVFAGFGSVLATAPVTVEAEGVIPPPSGSESPPAVLYVDHQPEVRLGQTVVLETTFGESIQLQGRITEVSHHPELRSRINQDLGDPDQATRLYDSGRRMRVLVDLDTAHDASLEGDLDAYFDTVLEVGKHARPVTGRIEIGQTRPIDLLLPSLSPREDRR